jgi:hypothetical protein
LKNDAAAKIDEAIALPLPKQKSKMRMRGFEMGAR